MGAMILFRSEWPQVTTQKAQRNNLRWIIVTVFNQGGIELKRFVFELIMFANW